jgi:dTDP-4-dehydrorhamnose 3,5-epimerase
MQIQSLEIPAIKILTPERHGDHRGFFSEIYSKKALDKLGISLEFVQENYSLSEHQYTVRGLHFQVPPAAQAKLVQVVRGSVLDVAVDLRRGSPWFGKSVTAEISAENWRQIYVPAGFAHGLCTLEPNTAVIYKVTAPYAPAHEHCIHWNDPALGVNWPANDGQVVISDKDRNAPKLIDYDSPFEYQGENS